MELGIDSTIMKRRPLFLSFFYTLFPGIVICVIALIFAVNYSTEKFYDSIIQKELKNRSANIFNWMRTVELKSGIIQKICLESSNEKSVRVTVVDKKGVVIGDSHKPPSMMDNHLNRPEIKQSLVNGSGFASRYSSTLQQELIYYAVSETIQSNLWIVRVSIPIKEYRVIISDLQDKIIVFGIFVSLALLYLSFIISKQITAPIEVIRKSTEKYVRKMKMSRPLEIPKTKELASLTISLNKIAKELDKRIKQIQIEKGDKESLLLSMQEGIIAINRNGRIISINEVAIDYLNIKKKKIIDQQYSDIIKYQKILSIIKSSVKKDSEDFRVYDKEIVIKSNKKRFFLISSSPLIRSNKKKGILIVMNDVTHKKQLEKVRQDFVANVSHELKTPITSITGFVEILNRNDLTKKEREQFLEKILNHTNRMNAIIDDLLKLSKIESQEEDESIYLQEQALLPILVGAQQDMENSILTSPLNVKITCGDDLYINADSQLLREAFLNVLENAMKYGFSNSPIQISVEVKKRLHIHFDNQGKSIKEKHWKRIFHRFYRVDKSRDRKAGGTGLGLAIVKHIAFVHGGEVKVSFSKNNLTRFTITLPLIS